MDRGGECEGRGMSAKETALGTRRIAGDGKGSTSALVNANGEGSWPSRVTPHTAIQQDNINHQ